MQGDPGDAGRRSLIAQLAIMGGAMTGAARAGAASDARRPDGFYDPRRDFNAIGDGAADDTRALQAAIDAGSANQRPIFLPSGAYKIRAPLRVPANTMLIGSAFGLGFNCRVEPQGCAAFVVGGATPSFQVCIENLVVWPRGEAPDFLISIDNSYSVTIRNLRIHDAQERLGRAAIVLLGDAKAGGHGRCNNIVWENLIVRNDSGQPGVAMLAGSGCGSHRFIVPDLENFGVLLDWQGGQLDLIAPYTERAGRYAVSCSPNPADTEAYLNTYGGLIDSAPSGIGCRIGALTRDLNSFGTDWGRRGGRAAYVFEKPAGSVIFHGLTPNCTESGAARFGGIAGWQRWIDFPARRLSASQAIQLTIPAEGRSETPIELPGVEVGIHWARASLSADTAGLSISAFVSKPGVVTVVVLNPTGAPIAAHGRCRVECGVA